MKVEIAIIGAGPAGSAAAIEFAAAGRSVLLIDKKGFPRNKVCGGCLSGPATERLRQLLKRGRETPDKIDLTDETRPCFPHDVPGIPGTQVTFVIGTYRLACNPKGATWIVPRADLDHRLVETACRAGAVFCSGQPASLERRPGGWDVIVGTDRVQSDWVLIASGLNGLPSRMGIRNRSRCRPMIAQQWVQPAREPLPALGAVELHWLHGGYVGLATPNQDECVVALACDTQGSGEQAESAFERLRRLNPTAGVWDLLGTDSPKRFGARGSAGFPWIPERLGDGNALLIGDAAGYAEPYSGEGIGQALCSATCAAKAVAAGGDVQTGYADLMRQSHERIVRRTRWVRTILRSSFVQYVASRRPLLPLPWLSRLVEGVHVKGAW